MSESRKNKPADQQSPEMTDEAKIDDKASSGNKTEESNIEKKRIEYRRDADLEDKTPAGDSGPEDADTDEMNMEGASDY